MPQDYIPPRRNDYRPWLQNLRDQSPANGPGIGAAPADVSAVVTQSASHLALMAATDEAKIALRAARAAERESRAKTNQLLRRKLGLWKRLDGFGPNHEVSLRVKSRKPAFDEIKFKPTFKARISGGVIRLHWGKRGVDGVMVYGRLHGQETWTRLGLDTMSPFVDTRPLAAPGVAEVREYRMLGVIKDREIGQFSNVVSVTWAGE